MKGNNRCRSGGNSRSIASHRHDCNRESEANSFVKCDVQHRTMRAQCCSCLGAEGLRRQFDCHRLLATASVAWILTFSPPDLMPRVVRSEFARADPPHKRLGLRAHLDAVTIVTANYWTNPRRTILLNKDILRQPLTFSAAAAQICKFQPSVLYSRNLYTTLLSKVWMPRKVAEVVWDYRVALADEARTGSTIAVITAG
jgi:hypothetical protein